MRRIKDQTSDAIKTAFTEFILTANNNIILKEYRGPRKKIKLTWSNDKFECSEVVQNN